MGLQGDIKDFSVVDILQLLYQQQKSGILTIAGKGNQVRVLFDKGMVISAVSTKRNIDEHLGEMLLKANLINKTQLQHALDTQKETLKQIGDILIENESITINDLRHFLMLQTHDTIFKLLNWKRGTYNFIQRIVTYNKKAIEPINTEHFLMDSLRMIDEWPEIKKKVYSYNLVFEKMPGADEEIAIWKVAAEGESSSHDNIFSERKEQPTDEKVMSFEERRIFNLVEGNNTVSNLINIGRIGEFETTKALASLMDKKLIDISFELEEEKVLKPTISIKNISFNVTFFSIFLIIFFYLTFSFPTIISNFTVSESRKAPFKYSKDITELENLDLEISTFYLVNSRYPEDLDELSQSDYVKSLRSGWKEGFEYSLSSKSYYLQIRR